jgi:hypothetical protein
MSLTEGTEITETPAFAEASARQAEVTESKSFLLLKAVIGHFMHSAEKGNT